MAHYKRHSLVSGKYLNVGIDKKQLLFKGQAAEVGEILILKGIDLCDPSVQSWVAHGRIKKIDDSVIGVEIGRNVVYEKINVSPGIFEVVKHHLPAEMLPFAIKGPMSKRPQVAFFMENIATHYSGGRYYAWGMIYALANIGFDVTVCTNIKPTFAMDFKNYPHHDRIRIMNNLYLDFDMPENMFDLFVGIPREGGVKAAMSGKNMNVPSALLIFESPNYTRLFREGTDSTDEYWDKYKKALSIATHVLSLNELCKDYTGRWLGNTYKPENISALYPFINDKVADLVPEQTEQHEIVFVSRLVAHKHPEHVITCLRNIPNPPKINFICNPIGEDRKKMYQDLAKGTNISMEFHMNVDDLEKFRIIKRSKAAIFPSTMEGFGMFPAEALYCEKPCICYDTPFFREEYKDFLEYADFKKGADDLGVKLNKVLTNKTYRTQRGKQGKEYIEGIMTFQAYCDNLRKIIERVIPNGIDKRLRNLSE